jgi:hypothetical protein
MIVNSPVIACSSYYHLEFKIFRNFACQWIWNFMMSSLFCVGMVGSSQILHFFDLTLTIVFPLLGWCLGLLTDTGLTTEVACT